MSDSSTQVSEGVIRDFLADRIGNLRSMITNLPAFEQRLHQIDETFFAIPADEGGPTAVDLLRRILSKRNLLGLSHLYDLRVLGTEFALLHNPGAGRKAAADILTVSTETGTFYVFEVKKDVATERQAVGELSAYSLGLQHLFWGMNATDQVWVPVSTVWSRPVASAFAHQVLFAGRAVLPIKATVVATGSPARIERMDLELLDLVPAIDEPLASTQFAWSCFDTYSIQLAKQPSDPRTVIDFIVGTASRLGYSGFVAYAVSPAENPFPYPYIFFLAAHNPIRGLLKRRQLQAVLVNGKGGLKEMRKAVRTDLFHTWDIDLRTGADCQDEHTEREIADRLRDDGHSEEADKLIESHKERVSVAEIAEASGNRLGHLFEEIKARIELLGDYELGAPDLRRIVHEGDILSFPPVDYVGYFGLMQEAVYERLLYEFRHASELGDGPVMGDLGGDPIRRASAPDTLFQFLKLMNWEHDCHAAYEDNIE